MRVYERICDYDIFIQGGPKRKTLSQIIIKSFELTPEGVLISFTICASHFNHETIEHFQLLYDLFNYEKVTD